jgi:serine/threonine protein kinase
VPLPDILESLNAALAGRYRIERELGAGGMAVVYLADDLKHRRRVAIKVLKPALAEVLGAERFLREIETTANLRHPHILPLYDSGRIGGSRGRVGTPPSTRRPVDPSTSCSTSCRSWKARPSATGWTARSSCRSTTRSRSRGRWPTR